MTTDLRELWADVPVGQPPLSRIVEAGDRRRRIHRRAVSLGVAAAVALAVGVVALWSPEHRDVAPVSTSETATVYYLLQEPVPDGLESYLADPARLLTPRRVTVAGTGDPAVDALRHLLSVEPPDGLIAAQFWGVRESELRIDVMDVRHESGLVTVELTRDPFDPCRVCGMVEVFEADRAALAWTMTVQDALRTDDPVEFVAEGQPIKGVWGWKVDGPIRAEPDVVVPPGPGSSASEMALPTSGWNPGDDARTSRLAGVLIEQDGCLRIDTAGYAASSVVWPNGFRAWVVGRKAVLVDGQGLLVAREGDRVELGGGTGTASSQPCQGGGIADGPPPFSVESDVQVTSP